MKTFKQYLQEAEGMSRRGFLAGLASFAASAAVPEPVVKLLSTPAGVAGLPIPAGIALLKGVRDHLDQYSAEDDDDYFEAQESMAEMLGYEGDDEEGIYPTDQLYTLLDLYEENPEQAADQLIKQIQSKSIDPADVKSSFKSRADDPSDWRYHDKLNRTNDEEIPDTSLSNITRLAGLAKGTGTSNDQEPAVKDMGPVQYANDTPALPAPAKSEFDLTPDLKSKEKVPMRRKDDDGFNEDFLNEFAEKPEDGPGSDDYEDLLFHLAYEIWEDDGEADQAKRKLSLLGWKPEPGDDYTAIVLYKIGGNDHRQYKIDDFEEYGQQGLNEFAPGGNSASSYYAVTSNFVNEFAQQQQEELQDLIDSGWTEQDLAQSGHEQDAVADMAYFEQVRDSFLKGLKPGFDAYLQGDTMFKDQLGAYWIENDLPLNQDWKKIYGEEWGDDGEEDELDKEEGNMPLTPAVDAKGRTQQQWIQAVKAKFPDAQIIQTYLMDGPLQANLSDGRRLNWIKVDQGVAEKLGDNRPKLGTARDQGKSVRKWRKARGFDESTELSSILKNAGLKS